MNELPRRALIPLLVSTVAAFAFFAPVASAATGEQTTFKFRTTNIKATYVDQGAPGVSPGDVYAIESDVVRKGKTVGHLYGSNTSVAIQGEVSIVSGLSTFELGGSDSIIVAGLTRVRFGAVNLTVGVPTTRTVIGGTGRYAGARGTIVSTAQADGTYIHVVHLLS